MSVRFFFSRLLRFKRLFFPGKYRVIDKFVNILRAEQLPLLRNRDLLLPGRNILLLCGRYSFCGSFGNLLLCRLRIFGNSSLAFLCRRYRLARVFSRKLLQNPFVFIVNRGLFTAARTDDSENNHGDNGNNQYCCYRNQNHHAVLLKKAALAKAYSRRHGGKRLSVILADIRAVAVHGHIDAFAVDNGIGKQALCSVDIGVELEPIDILARRIYPAGGIGGILEKALRDFAELFGSELIIVDRSLTFGRLYHRDRNRQRSSAVHALQINIIGLKILHRGGIVLMKGREVAVSIRRVTRNGNQFAGDSDTHFRRLREIVAVSERGHWCAGARCDKRARARCRDFTDYFSAHFHSSQVKNKFFHRIILHTALLYNIFLPLASGFHKKAQQSNSIACCRFHHALHPINAFGGLCIRKRRDFRLSLINNYPTVA